jgi:F-type H+-transporting ATPase subunit alpha
MPVEEQVVSIYAGTHGYLDDVPLADVRRFESDLLEFFRSQHSAVLDGIRSSGKIDDEGEFEGLLKTFASRFVPSETAEEA